MSAVPRITSDLGYAGLKMTADEFLALGQTRERYELIDGVVVMSPGATARHNETAAEIIFQFKAYARQTNAIRIFPETDVRFRADKVYCPDISVYPADQLAASVARLDQPPALIWRFSLRERKPSTWSRSATTTTPRACWSTGRPIPPPAMSAAGSDRRAARGIHASARFRPKATRSPPAPSPGWCSTSTRCAASRGPPDPPRPPGERLSFSDESANSR
jgi:hypothetical protein